MKVTVKINCDNAAFTDDPSAELARIFRGLAESVTEHDINYSKKTIMIQDINGNTVGQLIATADGRSV